MHLILELVSPEAVQMEKTVQEMGENKNDIQDACLNRHKKNN